MMKKRTLYDVLNNPYTAIGVDIDDSMIAIGDMFVKYAHIVFRDRLKHEFEYKDYSWMVLEEIKVMADAGITREDVSTMLKYMESEKVIERVMPRLHCIASLKTLSNRSDVYLVTSRGDNYYHDAIGMTGRWLDNIYAYTKYIPDGVIYNHDKAKVALEKNIGLFFEDNPLVAEKLLEAGIPVVLFNMPWNVMNDSRDKVVLTEASYIQKKRAIENIERYADTMMFRVQDWSYVIRNIK